MADYLPKRQELSMWKKFWEWLKRIAKQELKKWVEKDPEDLTS